MFVSSYDALTLFIEINESGVLELGISILAMIECDFAEQIPLVMVLVVLDLLRSLSVILQCRILLLILQNTYDLWRLRRSDVILLVVYGNRTFLFNGILLGVIIIHTTLTPLPLLQLTARRNRNGAKLIISRCLIMHSLCILRFSMRALSLSWLLLELFDFPVKKGLSDYLLDLIILHPLLLARLIGRDLLGSVLGHFVGIVLLTAGD